MDTTGETEVSIARGQEKCLMQLEKLQQLQLYIRELEEKNQEMQSRVDKLEEQRHQQSVDTSTLLGRQMRSILDGDHELQVAHVLTALSTLIVSR